MADDRGPRVRVRGLAEAQRDLRKTDQELAGEIRKGLKGAAEVVAAGARVRAPHRSGRLAASIKPSATNRAVAIRSSLVYAQPIHWGWPKRNIKPNRFIERAADATSDEAMAQLETSLDRLFARRGFK
jgi:hypothetical protein